MAPWRMRLKWHRLSAADAVFVDYHWMRISYGVMSNQDLEKGVSWISFTADLVLMLVSPAQLSRMRVWQSAAR